MGSSYALLIRPAANRVFAGYAGRLLEAELEAIVPTASDVRREAVAGLEYVRFGGEPDLTAVAALSSAYALFEVDDHERFRPVELPKVDRYDDDLVSTTRYVGKTNETFTKLLVNLALSAAGAWPPGVDGATRPARILDPLCGRGTTLNQALLYGADALGIDVDQKSTGAYETFLTTWLKEKRLKHQLDRGAGRRRFRATIGRKGGAGAAARQTVDVVTGDSADAAAAFGRGSVDAIATDLPYGVQHGARSSDVLARRPHDLLTRVLPAWRAVLRPGGAAAISWNQRTLRRDELVGHLAVAGFEVTALGASGEFVHRVDRTITRDLLVARRPGTTSAD